MVRLSAGLVALSAVLFVRPATPAAAVVVTPNCPWQTKLDANTTNVLFPDQNANYFILLYPIVGTAGLTIDGRYPHARYMSFTTYNNQTQAIDGVNDVHVDPLDGNRADNPFIAGNRRNTDGSVRDYRVQVIPGTRPAGEVHNRVYTTSTDYDPTRNTGHSNAVMYIVIYRTYPSRQRAGSRWRRAATSGHRRPRRGRDAPARLLGMHHQARPQPRGQ